MLRLIAVALVCATLAGCGTFSVEQHTPSFDAITTLRESGIASLNVGEFRLADGVNPKLDRVIVARATPVRPESGSSFSQYLRNALVSDLKAAGKFDPASPFVMRGELTDNQIHTGSTVTASASLAARFVIVHGETTVYDKILTVENSWPSNFVAAIAIPQAVNQYTENYSRLLAKLYTDDAFRRACKP